MSESGRKSNRLIHEKSPYLLQHAYNPVAWYPWGKEAFEKAKDEDKPIFLSIGYSTCHWCHVMEKESFEDEEVAALMNDAFVSIKVDREERPDVDNIYMTVCQMTTGSGGWPLTIIMSPDKKPFFAGTYFPKHGRFGRPGMLDLVPRLKEVWHRRREEVLDSADKITTALRQSAQLMPGEGLGEAVLHLAYQQMRQRFDEEYGGFGHAPKFPTPHNFLFLLRYWKRTANPDALRIIERSLRAMRAGGIFDHVGFGFHRYSTDQRWLVPHFEKMLYDQALLTMAYTETFQATRNPFYANTTEEILTYVLRDMTHNEGGFFSAEDADSEGVEGKFYLWTEKEIDEILTKREAEVVKQLFNVEPNGNFFEEATGSSSEANILHRKLSMRKYASELNLSESELVSLWEEARQKLFDHREKRIHPYKDDKILADWNGLMIAALAKAGKALSHPEYIDAAEKCVAFVRKHLLQPDGRLLHRYRDGEAGLPANVDDYAFLIWGLLELYEASFNPDYLKFALALNDTLISHFWDESGGGFFFTADDAEDLISRAKEIYDGAVPSGNSVAMWNLLRLSSITGNTQFDEMASAIERVFSSSVKPAPVAYTQMMIAVDFAVGPTFEVVIVGEELSKTRWMLSSLELRWFPNKVVLLKTKDCDISEIAPYTERYTAIDGAPTAYVCRNFVCRRPTTDAEEMLDFLSAKT